MSKFHINKHGVPAPCKAKPGNCPLGGDESHFDTKEEAQAHVDKINEQKHGIIAGINTQEDESDLLETSDGVRLKEGDYVFRYVDDDDEDAIFHDDSEALDYIKHVIYAEEAHPELVSEGLEEVEVTREMIDRYQRNKEEEIKNRTQGSYQGNEYKTSAATRSALFRHMTEDNLKDVFDDGFQNGDIPLSYKTESFNNTPVELNAQISKVGNDEYEVKGEIHEYSMIEDDFDSIDEFDDYLSDGPDMTYDVNYKFTSDELKNNLIESRRIGESGTSFYETQGVLFAGVYDMSRDNMS